MSDAFKTLSYSLNTFLTGTVRTIKTALWTMLMLFAVVTVLKIGVKVSPYLLRMYRSLLASIHTRREEAKFQRFLEEQQRRIEDQAEREQEDRKKRSHEERQNLIQSQLRKLKEQQLARRCFDQWQADSDIFFNNIAAMQRFLEPQMDRCDECRTQDQHIEVVFELRICQHSLEKLLLSSGNYEETLRRERRKWHPDKLHRTAEPVKDEMISKATSIFQMLEALHSKTGTM